MGERGEKKEGKEEDKEVDRGRKEEAGGERIRREIKLSCFWCILVDSGEMGTPRSLDSGHSSGFW